uniref:Glycosyl hydrolases family 22 (GH22) domain-containing protein n=2 Tax=Anolis carolinensis TaxID=28377 RepID=R4GBQ6_ANOCA
MKLFPLVVLFHFAATGTKGKIFSRCHLAHILQDAKVEGYEGLGVADWVCFATHASKLDSAEILSFTGPHRNYGIFKLSNTDHCQDNSRESYTNLCQTCCTYFVNEDLSDDIQCLKMHIKNKGLDSW